MARDTAFLDAVRTYYDKNTKRFVNHHESGRVNALHRAVWGPGVTTQNDAFLYVNARVLQVFQELTSRFPTPLRVLDLGCGVGGSLFYLAQRLPIHALGITLSPVQVALATQNARALQLDGQCRFIEADFLKLPDLELHAAVFAIESFVHGPDAKQFFAAAAAVMPSGGRLIICDDFLSVTSHQRLNREATRLLADFRRGWHVRSLITVAQAQQYAASAGLIPLDNDDLTPYLALCRPWDRFIAVCVTLGRGLPLQAPWWLCWVGGHALQMGLLSGLITYRFLVFKKS